MAAEGDQSQLHRALGGFAITVYAVGDILGAGIYALVGRVAGAAGSAAWMSFLVSATLAALTGLTYAELVSRHPVAAGAAAYCHRAFRSGGLAFVAGFLVLASGITSAAAVSHAFVGYLETFVAVPEIVASLALLVLISYVSYRGIRESSWLNLVLTSVELCGLLLIIAVGLYWAFGHPAEIGPRLAPGADLPATLPAILGGATIAFFAYIGFEDTVNVAEEVRDPARVMPRAILIAIAVTTLIYLGVTAAALLTVPTAQLAASDAPLLEVLDAAGLGVPREAFSVVAILAITNTGLLNLIMASRLTYGMASEGLLPPVLARVHPVRRTPWVAVLAVLALAVGLALSGGTQALAQTTSLLLLSVFTLVHVALIVVKRREAAPPGAFRAPRWTPWVGAAACAGMTLTYPLEIYLRALVVVAVGILAYLAVAWSKSRES